VSLVHGVEGRRIGRWRALSTEIVTASAAIKPRLERPRRRSTRRREGQGGGTSLEGLWKIQNRSQPPLGTGGMRYHPRTRSPACEGGAPEAWLPSRPDKRADSLKREFLSVKGLFGQFGNGLFDLDSVHSPPHGLITSIPQPSNSHVLRVTTGIPVARAIAAIWQSASAIGRPTDRRPAAIAA